MCALIRGEQQRLATAVALTDGSFILRHLMRTMLLFRLTGLYIKILTYRCCTKVCTVEEPTYSSRTTVQHTAVGLRYATDIRPSIRENRGMEGDQEENIRGEAYTHTYMIRHSTVAGLGDPSIHLSIHSSVTNK